MPSALSLTRTMQRRLRGESIFARLGRGILGSGGVWIVRLLTTVGMSFLLGRLMGPSEYGRYAYLVASVGLFAPICTMGFNMLSMREFSAARSDGDQAALARALGFFPKAVYRSTALLLVLLVPLSIAYNLYAGEGFEYTIFLEAVAISATAQLRLSQGSLRGLGGVTEGQVYQMVLPPVLNLAFFVMLLAFLRPTADLAIWTFVAGLVIVQPLASRAVRKRAGVSGEAVDRDAHKAWVKSAVILGISQVLFSANEQIPVNMTGFLADTTQVGLLDMARRFALLASVALNIVNMPLGPILAELYRKGDLQGFRRVAVRTTYFGAAMSVLVTAVYAVFGHWLLRSVRPEFEAAYPAMLVMCLGYIVNTMTGPVQLALTMTGHERDSLKGVVSAVLVNVGLCVALVPILGGVGGAIAGASGQMVWNVIIACLVARRLGFRIDILARTGKPIG